MLDSYSVEDEESDIALFRQGHWPVPRSVQPDEWMDFIAELVSAGKTMSRVHVLQSPLTEYLRYECEWGYACNVSVGDDVRILDTAERAKPAELPDQDFWLIDDTHVSLMHYDKQGRLLGVELAGQDQAPEYCRYRDMALNAAMPFGEYWAAHPQYWSPAARTSAGVLPSQ